MVEDIFPDSIVAVGEYVLGWWRGYMPIPNKTEFFFEKKPEDRPKMSVRTMLIFSV